MSNLEYALIATIMCIALLFGVKYIGERITDTFSDMESRITVLEKKG
jgi:Flp pilus assembly pilin Flp